MYDALRKSRAQRALDFGVYINKLDAHEGKFSKNVSRHLKKLSRQFTATSNDKVLGDMIKADLLVLAEVELFVAARNAGDEVTELKARKRAHLLWEEKDIIATRIAEELS
ncbi:hypothetical protein [Bacillus sp. mrc49]|uniref:hypothetical protein n=1 Tax=Bacillus sp. mrc49 TaxID=2054913 RepID=UPI000C2793D1|nr:hypothetical protein [Bacillus sp. mrc49]PJN90584.1 hypothetical protein CVN76_09500 [Bacillus sp. mrc49]